MTRQQNRRTGGGRRRGDNRRTYRDVWMLITTALVVIALLGMQQSLDAVRSGRHIAIAANCAVLSAVADAGRATIEHGATVTHHEETALLRLGFPPEAVREAAARAEARAYVASISQAVDRQIGHRGDRLIRRDGTVDCRRLEVLTHAEP